MLQELRPTDFHHAAHLFAALSQPGAQAVLRGLSPGRILVDVASQPRGALIWTECRFAFVSGSPQDTRFVDSLYHLLEEDLLPAALKSHDPTLVLHPASPGWIEPLAARFATRAPVPMLRAQFRFHPERFLAAAGPDLPGGYRLQPIDAVLAQSPDISGDLRVLWGGPQLFLAHGFGWAAVQAGQLACACFTAFATPDQAEASVFTHPQHRRRGLALAAAHAFIRQCIRQGQEPVWSCWPENAPSLALAARLGFERLEDAPVLFLPPRLP